MKKTLVIGSTVVDVIIGVNSIPRTQEDAQTTSHTMRLGGCAFNASEILRQSRVPYVLCSPVGGGPYGHFVETKLAEKNIPVFVKTPEKENGCCYCLVEKTGERTFISYHGAEYLFSKKWLSSINIEDFDSIYICGLEIEESTGIEIVEWLEENRGPTIFFAVGPRFSKIDKALMNRIFNLHPVIHLNEMESFQLSGKNTIEEAAREIFKITENSVVITLGGKGCFYLEGKDGHVSQTGLCNGYKADVVDTIGAGDSHMGALISGLKKGLSLKEACDFANKVSHAVVSVSGANLTDEEFDSLKLFG